MKEKLKCGLLGEKLGHSYSKQIHACLADYEYELYAVSRECAAEMIKGGELDGLNVTIPYKELAYSLCDELCDFAKAAKSVNTVVHRQGKIYGANTDVFGFISMVEHAGISFRGKSVIILGSGGTSKTARIAAKTMGAEKVRVVSRSGEINYDNVYSLTDTEIIVNTTPVGMYPNNGSAPVDLSRFPLCEGVVDVIYNPTKTKLILDAERLGIPCVSGLRMLAAQAKRAAEIFLDKSLPDSLIDVAEKNVFSTVSNIILIGMPGSGKSTVAKLVAKTLGRTLVDTDEVIRDRFGAPSEIITSQGEDEFRRLETEVIAELGKESGLVISTGGGIVEREENYSHLTQNGRIFLIERKLSRLARDDRPLSTDVSALYERRREKYNRFADVKIDNNLSPEKAAESIISLF